MLDEPPDHGVVFPSLTEAIDTVRAMWQMIGVLAELEGSLIIERSRTGVNERVKAH